MNYSKKDDIYSVDNKNDVNSNFIKALIELLMLKKADLNKLSTLTITKIIASIKDKIVKINGSKWSLKQSKHRNSSYYKVLEVE